MVPKVKSEQKDISVYSPLCSSLQVPAALQVTELSLFCFCFFPLPNGTPAVGFQGSVMMGLVTQLPASSQILASGPQGVPVSGNGAAAQSLRLWRLRLRFCDP